MPELSTEDLLRDVQRMLGELGSKVTGIERRLSAEKIDDVDERLTALEDRALIHSDASDNTGALIKGLLDRLEAVERRPIAPPHSELDRSASWLETYSGTFQALVANHWTNNSVHSLAELEQLARATANNQHGGR